MHSFKNVSELKNENKGEYIEGILKVPKLQDNAKNTVSYPDIELALYTTDKKPHVHLLHVTPMMKNPTEKLPKESYYVKLEYQNGTYVLDSSNHPYLPKNGKLVGSQFWNQETGEIILGKEGLRLTVVKPVGKGSPEEQEMRKLRGMYRLFISTYLYTMLQIGY